MEQIRKYPLEFAKPLLLCFDLLNRCNIGFFDENVPSAAKYSRFGYMIVCVVIHYTSTTGYMIKISSGPVNASELAYMVAVYLIQMQSLVKALIIISQKYNILDLVTRLGNTWRSHNLTEDKNIKKNNLLKRLHLWHIAFYWGSMIATYQHLMAPLVLTVYRKLVLHQDCDLQLPFGCVYPFDPVKNWYIYLAVYILQVHTMLRVVSFYIGTEFLVITLSSHITTEFALLREDLREVTSLDEYVDVEMGSDEISGAITLQMFICRHQRLIQLTKQLDSIFNRMMFIDLLFATVIVCFFGFGATVTHDILDKVNNYIAVLALLFPIYVLCLYGDLLKEESAGVAASAYENLWYQHNTRYQKIISFIIMRSEKPCCLTSLEYTPITLSTFTKVLSTTWSYFSLATSVYSKS